MVGIVPSKPVEVLLLLRLAPVHFGLELPMHLEPILKVHFHHFVCRQRLGIGAMVVLGPNRGVVFQFSLKEG